MSATALKARILATVDPLPSLTGLVRTGGRLDVCKAVPGCNQVPVAVNDFYSTPQGTRRSWWPRASLVTDTDADGNSLDATEGHQPGPTAPSPSTRTAPSCTPPTIGCAGFRLFHLQGERRLDSNAATVSVTITGSAADLIGYWTMDETSSTIAHDAGTAPANNATTV